MYVRDMKTEKETRRKGWLKPNRTENHATAFSKEPGKDRAPLMGLEGKTVTTLRPTGEIKVKGRHYDAVAEGAFVEREETVRVTGTRDFRLVVEKVAGA